jgi:hypothetical protein
LKKKGGLLSMEWQDRYFRPSAENGQVLEYLISAEHMHVQGSFDMAGATVAAVPVKEKTAIEVRSLLWMNRSCSWASLQVSLATGKKYYLLADSEAEHEQWLDGLQKMTEGPASSTAAVKKDEDSARSFVHDQLLETFKYDDLHRLYQILTLLLEHGNPRRWFSSATLALFQLLQPQKEKLLQLLLREASHEL